VATAVAVPMQVVRSHKDAIALFGSLPGIQVKVTSDQHNNMQGAPPSNVLDKMFQQESTMLNPFGIATATSKSMPIQTTAEGEATVANLYVASADRFKGDMSAAIILPDNMVLAQWSRSQRPSMIQSGQTVMPLNVFGAPYGQLQTSSWGQHHSFVDASGTGSGVKVVSQGCFQPQSYMCIGGFLCFFPTCGIASCIIFCMMAKTPGLFKLKRAPDGVTVGTLKYWAEGSTANEISKIRLEFAEETDAKTRLEATLATLFFIADAYIDPPRSSGHAGGGGGGGGAPDVAVMDR